MKLKLAITLFFLNVVAYAQIQERPADFKKIKFVYETTSNYRIENQRVYADTTLLKVDFPTLKWSRSPKLDGSSEYYLPLTRLSAEHLNKLKSILYHENQTYIGEYDKVKDKTIFQVVRGDKVTREIFKEVFKDSYENFKYRIEINYKKGTYDLYYPRVSYNRTVAEHSFKIEYKNDTIGVFVINTVKNVYKNLVLLNKNLDAKIMPDELFSNATCGVAIVKSLRSTTVLKSVEYVN
ncbi:hypothetical protein [Flavobacterium sp.]|uniref:hypothetical protein n=1 Tax=Flavobacterium sp. TaxID=239 RepID=UPI002634F21C|nr:hypothetical protein [Flavobacterium sp.]